VLRSISPVKNLIRRDQLPGKDLTLRSTAERMHLREETKPMIPPTTVPRLAVMTADQPRV